MPHDLELNANGAPQGAHSPLIAILSFLVILTLLIGAMGEYVYSRLREEQRHEIERTLVVIAEQKRQQIESWLAQTREDTRLYFTGLAPIVQRLAAWQAGGRQDEALLTQARERILEIKEVRGWSALAVLDSRGEPMITLGPTNYTYHAQEIQDVLAHPRLLAIDLHPHPNGQSEYGLLTPLTLPDGRLLGLAYLSWLADQTLFPLIAAWPVPTQTAETYLVRREEEEVRYLTPLRHEPDVAPSKRLPLSTHHLAAALAVQGQEGILPEARDYRNEPVLAYATAIAGTPWQMIAEIDQREAQAGMRQTAWVTVLIIGLVLLLTYSLAFTRWRRERQRLLSATLQATRLLEQRFRTIFEEAPLGVALIDSLDGHVYEVNQRFADIAGRSREALARIDWMQITHPDDVQEDLDQMARLNAGEIPGFQMVKRYLQPDGTVVWIDMTIAPLRVAPGERRRHLCMIQDITARRAQERALAAAREASTRLEGERRWKLALDAAGHGVWDWNIATGRVDYSPTWKRMLGFDEADIGDTAGAWEQLVHPEDLAGVQAARKAHLAGETPGYESVHRLRCQDGLWKWILDRGTVLERDTNGKPLRMLGTHTDIDAQKRAEESLRQTQQRLAEAQAIAHLGSFEYDAATRQTRWSDEEYRIYGLDLAGDSPVYDDLLARCIHPEDADLLHRTFGAALENLSVFELEHRIVRPDGSVRWVYNLAHPSLDTEGRLVRYVGVTLDITERKQSEEDLRRLHTILEAALAAMSDAVFITDSARQIVYLNGAFATFHKFKHPDECAKNFANFPDFLEFALADGTLVPLEQWAVPRALRGETVTGAEYRLRRKDTGETWLGSYNFAPIRGADGNILGSVVTSRDITEDKALRQALEEERAHLEDEVVQRTAEARAASAAKSEFLAHMSHEIRTPMNAVLGLAQLLSRQALSPEQRDLVQRIQGAGQSLQGIINDILDFSKIEAGQLHLDARPFHLETLTAKVASLFGATATAKGLELRIESLAESPGPLLGDALRLEQVLINLTGNAIKFTAQGEVAILIQTLSLSETAVRLRFEVRDTGLGISPEVQATLFTPFTQADAGISRRFGGTGLGLSIAKRLVELMGGTIGVDSQPGQGSTFWVEVTLPRTTAAAVNGQAAAPVSPSGPRLRGLRLLAVDDSAMNRDLVERALHAEGALVTLAADGLQAMQYLRTAAPGFDAVLMDVRMPVMDGLTAMRQIRHELGLKDLPLLALTAGVLPAEQQAARDAGANEVLAKPLDLDLLATRLAHHVGAERLATAAAVAAVATEAGHGATSLAGPTGRGDALPTGGGGPARGGEAGPNAFPAIPGIDRERVALTFKDDLDFFLALLQRLTQEATAGLVQARQALASGDRDTARRCLHSLKGNAGNVGALTLMAAAGQLETALQAGATDLETGLADLERQVADLTAASAQWRPARARGLEAAASGAVSPPPDEHQLAALRDALRRQRLQARQLFKELEAGLVAAHGQDLIAPLGEAIGSLRFDVALTLLEALPPAGTSRGSFLTR